MLLYIYSVPEGVHGEIAIYGSFMLSVILIHSSFLLRGLGFYIIYTIGNLFQKWTHGKVQSYKIHFHCATSDCSEAYREAVYWWNSFLPPQTAGVSHTHQLNGQSLELDTQIVIARSMHARLAQFQSCTIQLRIYTLSHAVPRSICTSCCTYVRAVT